MIGDGLRVYIAIMGAVLLVIVTAAIVEGRRDGHPR